LSLQFVVGLVDLICLLPARTDLFSLEIKVEGFNTTDALGRKVYTKGFVIKWDVEIGLFSLDLLRESLQNEVKWPSNQSASLWFFDKNVQEDVRLDSEIQMIDLFDMYKSEMCCRVLVGVFDNVVSDAHEYELLEPLCVIPLDDGAFNPTNFNPDANASTAAIPNANASTAASPNANALTIASPDANASSAAIPNAQASTDANHRKTMQTCPGMDSFQ
jgi:hypothetical protein